MKYQDNFFFLLGIPFTINNEVYKIICMKFNLQIQLRQNYWMFLLYHIELATMYINTSQPCAIEMRHSKVIFYHNWRQIIIDANADL